MPDPNRDLTPPVTIWGPNTPFDLRELQLGRIPTFWEDNQVLDDETFEYSQSSGMTANTPLHVPKVCRFIYAYDTGDEYGNNGSDPGGGGGSPGTVTWKVIEITIVSPPNFVFGVRWQKVEVGGTSPTVQYFINNLSAPRFIEPSEYDGLELELPYGEVPSIVNDGVYFG